jgi:hypothetical protein
LPPCKGKNNTIVRIATLPVEYLRGRFLNSNKPDIMLEGGVGCIDCHIVSDKVYKPDSKICMKCHEQGYDEQMIDWKKDVNKMLIEANSLIEKTAIREMSNEERDEINEIKKLVNQIESYPSIYVHNYDLVSSVLSDRIKILKKYFK